MNTLRLPERWQGRWRLLDIAAPMFPVSNGIRSGLTEHDPLGAADYRATRQRLAAQE